MARYNKQAIYLDLCALRKEVRMAGYAESMTARDRVDFLLPIQEGVARCLRCYIRAYRAADAAVKAERIEELATEFAVMLCDLRIADDEHIWRGKKDADGNVCAAKRIFDIIPRVDEGIERWAASMKKGRPAPELKDAAG